MSGSKEFGMSAIAFDVWLIGTGVGVALVGVASVVKATAWRIWASRCHPKGRFQNRFVASPSQDSIS
jgi:hypothetical protein